MGQTLTHGVYLPDEGERNCYSGLASNWQLLDGAVGTIAEHTTQIAGKASASHSHGNITNDGKVGTTANLPLITGTGGVVQAGSFGTSANTFCEGNDSRLSDARTPVAHTHTKSDVTDLLNSDFIPRANNSYDLGSSSYQWNNLYAKNYFYNGTAWGLDKANVWTGDNTFSGATNSVFYFKFGTSGSYSDIKWKDNNGSQYATLRSKVNELILGLQYSSASAWYNGASVNINNNGSVQIKAYNGTEPWTTNFTSVGVYPTSNKALELGTSTNKWKSLNGVNPGALSLPKAEYTDIDISDQGLNWDLTGGANTYTPTIDGWLDIWAKRGSLTSAYIDVDNTYIRNNTEVSVLSQAKLTVPIRNGQTYTIRILAEQCWVRRIKAEGNV